MRPAEKCQIRGRLAQAADGSSNGILTRFLII